jgi:phage terminase small subunit
MTKKEKLFCEFYISEAAFNGTKAAKLAGYSVFSARQIASEKLTKPDIQNFISALASPTLINLKVSRERLIEELSKIAFSDLSEFFDGSIENKDLSAIKSISVSNDTLHINAHDKLKAIDILSRLVS